MNERLSINPDDESNTDIQKEVTYEVPTASTKDEDIDQREYGDEVTRASLDRNVTGMAKDSSMRMMWGD